MLKNIKKITTTIARLGMTLSLFTATAMIAPLCFMWLYELKEPDNMKMRLRKIKKERR